MDTKHASTCKIIATKQGQLASYQLATEVICIMITMQARQQQLLVDTDHNVLVGVVCIF